MMQQVMQGVRLSPCEFSLKTLEKYNYKEYMLVGNCGLMVELLLLLQHATSSHHHMLKFQQENQSHVESFIYAF